jgi:hypothetical protein
LFSQYVQPHATGHHYFHGRCRCEHVADQVDRPRQVLEIIQYQHHLLFPQKVQQLLARTFRLGVKGKTGTTGFQWPERWARWRLRRLW